jgi:hypothetical protein
VDEREIVPGGGIGLDAIGWTDDAGLDQAGVHEGVFARGEDVRPDIDLIPGRIDDDQRRAR